MTGCSQEDAAATWRGPMVMSALETFITGVDWGATDVLVVDMPPGTGNARYIQQILRTRRISVSPVGHLQRIFVV